jgi:hypothetical protein
VVDGHGRLGQRIRPVEQGRELAAFDEPGQLLDVGQALRGDEGVDILPALEGGDSRLTVRPPATPQDV